MTRIFKTILIFILGITPFIIIGQEIPIYGAIPAKINLGEKHLKCLEKNIINISDRTNIYVGDGHSQELHYYVIKPDGEITGVLVLFPPTGQSTENVINHNIELIEQSISRHLLIIVPSINFNLYLDSISIRFLNSVFSDLIEIYEPPVDKVIFGGFSLGGMNAIRYTELAYEDDPVTIVKPCAVYGIDPPLDLTRLYYSFERTIEKNYSQPAIQEARSYLNKMNQQFGGSPKEKPDIYEKHSMYSRSVKNGGNSKYLLNLSVRIYSDPDIDWQLKNRHMDFYDMNALDQTAMINELNLMGNMNAEFISALGKGYRLNGKRHPHSWSIAEPKECLDWILECINQ